MDGSGKAANRVAGSGREGDAGGNQQRKRKSYEANAKLLEKIRALKAAPPAWGYRGLNHKRVWRSAVQRSKPRTSAHEPVMKRTE